MKIIDFFKKSKRNKIIVIVLVIVICYAFSFMIDLTRSIIRQEDISKQVSKVRIADDHDLSKMGMSYKDKIFEKYDTVKFGKYYQSAINKIKTPIEWIVLTKEDDKALLFSKYILDCKPFNDKYKKECHWNDSTIREWLNNDFYNAVFDESEKQMIVMTELENKKNVDAFLSSKATDSENTFDNVFLLSDAEFLKYFTANRFYQDPEYVEKERQLSIELWGEDGDKELSYNYDNSTTCGTQYAYKQGLKNPMFEQTANYWLRTNASKNNLVMFVSYKGWHFWDVVSSKIYGIRPAIWVKTK